MLYPERRSNLLTGVCMIVQDKMKPVWIEEFPVFWHDANVYGKMTFAAISRYIQETAWNHSDNLGVGFKKALELNQIWVVMRLLISVEKFPAWGDNVRFETWPRGVDGPWAYRDFYIKNKRDEILGGASTSWMLLDYTTHRPQKPDLVKHALPLVNSKLALGRKAEKIAERGNFILADKRKLRFSDIDLNGHVTNSKYIEWIADTMGDNGNYKKFQTLQINFVSEAMFGEEVEMWRADTENACYVKCIRKSDTKTIFIAELNGTDLTGKNLQ